MGVVSRHWIYESMYPLVTILLHQYEPVATSTDILSITLWFADAIHEQCNIQHMDLLPFFNLSAMLMQNKQVAWTLKPCHTLVMSRVVWTEWKLTDGNVSLGHQDIHAYRPTVIFAGYVLRWASQIVNPQRNIWFVPCDIHIPCAWRKTDWGKPLSKYYSHWCCVFNLLLVVSLYMGLLCVIHPTLLENRKKMLRCLHLSVFLTDLLEHPKHFCIWSLGLRVFSL